MLLHIAKDIWLGRNQVECVCTCFFLYVHLQNKDFHKSHIAHTEIHVCLFVILQMSFWNLIEPKLNSIDAFCMRYELKPRDALCRAFPILCVEIFPLIPIFSSFETDVETLPW